MNQILYTGGKNRKSSMSDKNKIIIFFVVFIIIFGICAIALGVNLLGKVQKPISPNPTIPEAPNVSQNPNIEVSFRPQVGKVSMIVTSDINIETISYWWNDEEIITLQVDNVTEYETEIQSKSGTNKLNVEVINENGGKKTISQIVIGDLAPEVEIGTDRISNYVIKVDDDIGIEKIVIILNGETEEIEVNDSTFEYKVPIPLGNSLIEVTAYDSNGQTTTKKAKITNFSG